MRSGKSYIFFLTGIFLFFILFNYSCIHNDQTNSLKTGTDKDSIQKDTINYSELKKKIVDGCRDSVPGQFGEFIKGIKLNIDTKEKIIALTFDACGGRGSGYNDSLINYLRKEKIPATLFISGRWIEANEDTFMNLAKDTLFEIENHGLQHRLCSVNGKSVYGVAGTKNVGEVIDEMELNARKIEKLTGTRPKYFRSATAYTDDVCVKIAGKLNLQIVNYSVLSGDAIPYTPAKKISRNILKQVKPGSIVIMHFNHPEWKEKEALEIVVPKLKEKGYSFVKLKDRILTGNQDTCSTKR
jgi:peptidoglycan/xylan/chitin deacetylase (PgdA/CDA1 family)